MPDRICYRGYKLTRQEDEFYACSIDQSEPPILIVARSVLKLCNRIDQLWDALATGVYPAWVSKWLEGDDPRIDPDTLEILDALIGTMDMAALEAPGEVATYTTDPAGYIDFYNEAAAELWGYRPELGVAQWHGAYRLFEMDGVTPIPHDKGPMARALKEMHPLKGIELIIERPDGSRTIVRQHPSPLKGEDGAVVGAINYIMNLVDEEGFEEINPDFAVVAPKDMSGRHGPPGHGAYPIGPESTRATP